MQDPLPNRERGLPEERYYDPRTDESWSDILHNALAELSVNSLVSGESRGDFDPEDGTMYVPADGTGPLYLGDGSEWTELGELIDPSRVTAIEDAVDVLQSDVDSVETSVSDLESLTSTLESNLSTHTSADNPHGIDTDTTGAMPQSGGDFGGLIRTNTTGEGAIIGNGDGGSQHYISFRNSGYGPKIGYSTSPTRLAFQPEENDTGKGMAFLGGDSSFGNGTLSLTMSGDDYSLTAHQGLDAQTYLTFEGEDVATQTWVNNQDFGSGGDITPEEIGALPTSGGTVTGDLGVDGTSTLGSVELGDSTVSADTTNTNVFDVNVDADSYSQFALFNLTDYGQIAWGPNNESARGNAMTVYDFAASQYLFSVQLGDNPGVDVHQGDLTVDNGDVEANDVRVNGVLEFEPQSSDPSSPSDGSMWYRS